MIARAALALGALIALAAPARTPGAPPAPAGAPVRPDAAALREKVRSDPGWLARRVAREPLWSKEIDVCKSVLANRRTAARGCVSSGKTHAAAFAALNWLFGQWPTPRVFTLAPSYRQVEHNLWGELRRVHRKADPPLGGRLYEGAEYQLGPGWYMLGFSVREPERMHGIHGPNDLLIVDDAHGVPREVFDAAENMMAGGNSRMLILFNPAALSGETYDCAHSRRGLYGDGLVSIGWRDLPPGIPGLLSPAQVEEWRRTYGEASAFFRVKAEGDYPPQEADTLIPLGWVEAAMARELPPWPPGKAPPPVELGVDVARFGDDATVLCPRRGREVLAPVVMREADTMAVAGRVARACRELGASSVFVDEVGVGAGVVDRLREQGAPVRGVNAGRPARDASRFANLRSELWWRCREALDPAGLDALSLPRDQELAGELSSVKYSADSSGRIKVEAKDEMKARLGRSPDRADALCLALFGRAGGSAGAALYRPAQEAYAT